MITFKYAQLGCFAKRYCIYYYAVDPTTGLRKIKRDYLPPYKDKRLLERHAIRHIDIINKKLDTGWNPFVNETNKNQFVTIANALEFISAYKLAGIRDSSKKNYRQRIKLLQQWCSKHKHQDKLIKDFTQHLAQQFMDELLLKREIIGRTFNNYLIDYRTFFNLLIKRKYLGENPFHSIDKLKETQKIKIPFTAFQRKVYADYLLEKDPNFYIVSMLCFYCGLRPNEIVQLKVGDVILHKQSIQSCGSISKNRKVRIIKVADVFWPSLVQWIGNSDAKNYLVSKLMIPGKIKCPSTDLPKHFRKIANVLKFPSALKFYSLKDTCADLLSEHNIPTTWIRDLFDHSSIAVTDSYMKHFGTKEMDELARRFPKF